MQKLILEKVVGMIDSTQKNKNLKGFKILAVQPVSLEGAFTGCDILAFDAVVDGIELSA